jgi:hypothetical protein
MYCGGVRFQTAKTRENIFNLKSRYEGGQTNFHTLENIFGLVYFDIKEGFSLPLMNCEKSKPETFLWNQARWKIWEFPIKFVR